MTKLKKEKRISTSLALVFYSLLVPPSPFSYFSHPFPPFDLGAGDGAREVANDTGKDPDSRNKPPTVCSRSPVSITRPGEQLTDALLRGEDKADKITESDKLV
mmetsp:Transcript_11188/g.20253  ORF Transcript_11188/g.20253 Transcript_11188/m.20253 type:complete len:103 (-) Transcript_11188:580-888(-)